MNKLLMVTAVPVVSTNFLIPFATHFRDRGWQVDAMSCGFSSDDKCDRLNLVRFLPVERKFALMF